MLPIELEFCNYCIWLIQSLSKNLPCLGLCNLWEGGQMWRQYWTITVINHLQWALWLGKVSVGHLLWRRTFVMLDLWSLLNKYFAFGSNKANMNLFLIENYSGLGIKLLNISFWTEKKIYWLSSDCDVRKSVVCESIRPAIFKAFSTKLWWLKS